MPVIGNFERCADAGAQAGDAFEQRRAVHLEDALARPGEICAVLRDEIGFDRRPRDEEGRAAMEQAAEQPLPLTARVEGARMAGEIHHRPRPLAGDRDRPVGGTGCAARRPGRVEQRYAGTGGGQEMGRRGAHDPGTDHGDMYGGGRGHAAAGCPSERWPEPPRLHGAGRCK